MSIPNRNAVDRIGVGTAGALAMYGAINTARTTAWSKQTTTEKVKSATWTAVQGLAAYAALSTALSSSSKK